MSIVSSNTSNTSQRAIIESQIASLRLELVHLTRPLNDLTAVGVLNDDVLSYIFHMLSPRPHQTKREYNMRSRRPQKPEDKHPTRDTRMVSQVCHKWRQIAIQSSSLWASYLDCQNESLQWLLELVERSKKSPVTVVADDLSSPHCQDSLMAVLRRVEAVGKLSLAVPFAASQSEMEDYMEKLLQVIHSSTWLAESDGISLHLRGGRTLFNNNISVGWPVSFRPGLLSLYVEPLPGLFSLVRQLVIKNPSRSYSPVELVQTLRHFPRLSSLRLENTMRTASLVNDITCPVLVLPNLHSLAIVDYSINDVGQFLNCVSTSSRYSLELICYNEYPRLSSGPPVDLLIKSIHKWAILWSSLSQTPALSDDLKVHVISSYRKLSIRDISTPSSRSFNIDLKLCPSFYPNLNSPLRQAYGKVTTSVFHVMQGVLQQAHFLQITPDWKSPSICPPAMWEAFKSIKDLRLSLHPESRNSDHFQLFGIAHLARTSLPLLKCISVHWFDFYPGGCWYHLAVMLMKCQQDDGTVEELQFSNGTVVETFSRKDGPWCNVKAPHHP